MYSLKNTENQWLDQELNLIPLHWLAVKCSEQWTFHVNIQEQQSLQVHYPCPLSSLHHCRRRAAKFKLKLGLCSAFEQEGITLCLLCLIFGLTLHQAESHLNRDCGKGILSAFAVSYKDLENFSLHHLVWQLDKQGVLRTNIPIQLYKTP